MKYNIYCDGSSKANGTENNGGGWGIAIFDEEDNMICGENQYSSGVTTTNNEQELLGLIAALKYTQEHQEDKFTIYCDSAYCVNAFNSWIEKWKNLDWKRDEKGAEVKNLELMKQLDEYRTINFPNFTIEKVKGHAGNKGNELADKLASLKESAKHNTGCGCGCGH